MEKSHEVAAGAQLPIQERKVRRRLVSGPAALLDDVAELLELALRAQKRAQLRQYD